jgi:hypothetical protein
MRKQLYFLLIFEGNVKYNSAGNMKKENWFSLFLQTDWEIGCLVGTKGEILLIYFNGAFGEVSRNWI